MDEQIIELFAFLSTLYKFLSLIVFFPRSRWRFRVFEVSGKEEDRAVETFRSEDSGLLADSECLLRILSSC